MEVQENFRDLADRIEGFEGSFADMWGGMDLSSLSEQIENVKTELETYH
jgi:hypothetical protein